MASTARVQAAVLKISKHFSIFVSWFASHGNGRPAYLF